MLRVMHAQETLSEEYNNAISMKSQILIVRLMVTAKQITKRN